MSESSSSDGNRNTGAVLHFGDHELVIRQRYEVVSIINDILIGIWFTIGSFFFFSDALTYAGTWFFVIGSVELLIRPIIRLGRRIHLRRFHPDAPGTAEASRDF
jgi:hypothetical protein